ncbi:alpha/beta hydrolase [Actinosynnema sp. NPDC020468]|uniref:alpha/beta hydrolase n=1 Tax=Actinosynnema sp. NPDC020468 TaxID=3154488 RepID=UPI0033C0FA7A
MRPISSAFGGVLAASALLVGLAPGAVAQPPAPGTIAWAPCPGLPTVECGTLALPIDRANPGAGTFGLAVARRKATDPAKRVGVLVINPGGPGGSGVNFAQRADQYFSKEITERFDVVGFDPRGVARSNPVTCSLSVLNRQPAPPTTAAEFDALGAYNRELTEDCRRHSGPIVDHADTGAVVDDVDALRRSLGETKISYYGVSYGTLIGQQYAERYGRNVRALVIDSTMDHSLDTWRFTETQAATAEDSFAEWVKWCDRDTACALHGKDVTKVWNDLLARADRGEITDPEDATRHVPASEITDTAVGTFYGPDWTALADYVATLSAQKPAALADQAETAAYPFAAVFCQDWSIRPKSFREFSTLAARARRLAPHTRGSTLATNVLTSCVGLPGDVNNPQRRPNLRDSPRILLLNARHDPATSYAWAVNVHRQTRAKTVFVTYEGWGHGVYTRTPCTRSTTDTYLLTTRLPTADLTCAAPTTPVPGARAVESPTTPTFPWSS